MKKHLKILVLSFGVLAFSGCSNPVSDIDSTKIVVDSDYVSDYLGLNRFNVNLHVGETHQISMLSIPSKYASDKISYRSKDSSVCSVSEKGLVTANKVGFTQVELVDDKGKVVEKLNVAVCTDLTNQQTVSQCDKLYKNMTAPGFIVDNKIMERERAHEEFVVDNKVTREVSYVEDIVLSIPDAYFKVSSQDISVYTENGSIEHSSGAWEFIVEEDMSCYLYHTTATAKNVYVVDTSGYLSAGVKPEDRIQVIYDLLDMFFVDGKSIATDMLRDASGVDDVAPEDPTDLTKGFITGCFAKDYDNVPSKKAGISGENDLFASITLANDGEVVDAELEDDVDVESGTVYNDRQTIDTYYHENRVEGMYVTSSMEYEIDGKAAKRTFDKEYRFERDFEIQKPVYKDYEPVKELYDL